MEPVLVTGASGFLAKHVVLRLLNAGHPVRGTLRRMDRTGEVRAALRPWLKDPGAEGRLSFAPADLEADAEWPAAMAGMAAVVHVASPFPVAQPKEAAALIGPAVGGTGRVLRAAAAAGVRRVVVTSSTVAIADPRRPRLQDEGDWLDPDAPGVAPYARSKLLAERQAWALAAELGLALTTVNPGLILGPPLDAHYGASVRLVERILRGRDAMLPDLGFPVVDARDAAEMHLRALQRPATAGRRYIAAAGSLTLVEMGRLLKAAWPARRIATRRAPALLLRLLALADPELRAILPRLGRVERVANLRAVREMEMEFLSPALALRATADWLVRNGRVWA
jgi:dihydroflavonol-4-reductase